MMGKALSMSMNSKAASLSSHHNTMLGTAQAQLIDSARRKGSAYFRSVCSSMDGVQGETKKKGWSCALYERGLHLVFKR